MLTRFIDKVFYFVSWRLIGSMLPKLPNFLCVVFNERFLKIAIIFNLLNNVRQYFYNDTLLRHTICDNIHC